MATELKVDPRDGVQHRGAVVTYQPPRSSPTSGPGRQGRRSDGGIPVDPAQILQSQAVVATDDLRA